MSVLKSQTKYIFFSKQKGQRNAICYSIADIQGQKVIDVDVLRVDEIDVCTVMSQTRKYSHQNKKWDICLY